MTSSDEERLAEYAHAAWSKWMKHLFSKTVKESDGLKIPQIQVDRWQRQMNTPYAELSEDEKASDRAEAKVIQAVCFGRNL